MQRSLSSATTHSPRFSIESSVSGSKSRSVNRARQTAAAAAADKREGQLQTRAGLVILAAAGSALTLTPPDGTSEDPGTPDRPRIARDNAAGLRIDEPGLHPHWRASKTGAVCRFFASRYVESDTKR